jgi:hypothetical protein
VLDFRDREKIICFVWDVAIPQHSLAPVALGEQLLIIWPHPASWASLRTEGRQYWGMPLQQIRHRRGGVTRHWNSRKNHP